MSDLHRCRPHSLFLLCVSVFVVCAHAAFAATPLAHADTVANAVTNPAIPTAVPPPAGALTPELEGDLLMVHRSYAAALDAYKRDTKPSAVLINKIGVAYHHMFALDEARKYYQQALAMKPEYAEALNNLAAVYHGQHDYAQAEKIYKRALRFQPNSAILYCNLGTSYFAEAKYKSGMEAYSKAMALNPHVFDAGQVQIVEEATTRRQIVAINYFLARTYATSGNLPQAISYLRKALQNGFRDQKQLMREKDFAVLRSTPEFQKLLLDEGGRE